jgi:hypothetical protein
MPIASPAILIPENALLRQRFLKAILKKFFSMSLTLVLSLLNNVAVVQANVAFENIFLQKTMLFKPRRRILLRRNAIRKCYRAQAPSRGIFCHRAQIFFIGGTYLKYYNKSLALRCC